MKRVGRVVMAQDMISSFFAKMPEGMRVLEAIVTQFRMLPPELEFVMDWNGFDSIPDACIPPLYEAVARTDDRKWLFKRA